MLLATPGNTLQHNDCKRCPGCGRQPMLSSVSDVRDFRVSCPIVGCPNFEASTARFAIRDDAIEAWNALVPLLKVAATSDSKKEQLT